MARIGRLIPSALLLVAFPFSAYGKAPRDGLFLRFSGGAGYGDLAEDAELESLGGLAFDVACSVGVSITSEFALHLDGWWQILPFLSETQGHVVGVPITVDAVGAGIGMTYTSAGLTFASASIGLGATETTIDDRFPEFVRTDVGIEATLMVGQLWAAGDWAIGVALRVVYSAPLNPDSTYLSTSLSFTVARH